MQYEGFYYLVYILIGIYILHFLKITDSGGATGPTGSDPGSTLMEDEWAIGGIMTLNNRTLYHSTVSMQIKAIFPMWCTLRQEDN